MFYVYFILNIKIHVTVTLSTINMTCIIYTNSTWTNENTHFQSGKTHSILVSKIKTGCSCQVFFCYLKSVCSQELLGCSSVGNLADGGAGGHEDRGAGQDLRRHQAWRHRAQVGIKGCSCSSSCCAGVSSQAWCHWEYGLQAERKKYIWGSG